MEALRKSREMRQKFSYLVDDSDNTVGRLTNLLLCENDFKTTITKIDFISVRLNRVWYI